ncbi:MAG: aldo/keto reductase [Actinomycetota bacterium]|nr:aldo/keto reductase [Actinomycetota bacterium]
MDSVLERRRLGRTEHDSSVAVLGCAAFSSSSPDEVAVAVATALDAGVNHLDVAPSYGEAELLLGPVLEGVRDRFFVACKTQRHQADGVRSQLEESLRRLRCDHVDLYQLHAVTDLEELDRRAGAVAAALAARDEGLCRFVGITGHELTTPAAQLEAVRRYDLDTVMFPVNPRLWAEEQYRSDAEALLDEARRRDLGVMAIKAAAARPWGGRQRTATTWYEPYRDPAEVARGVRFALSVPGIHAFCTPGDTSLLPTVLGAAQSFEPLDGPQRAEASRSVVDEPLIFPMPHP